MKICSRIAGKAKNHRAARKRTPVDLGKAVKLGKSTSSSGSCWFFPVISRTFWDGSIHICDDYDEYGIESGLSLETRRLFDRHASKPRVRTRELSIHMGRSLEMLRW
jgi:hypothetical protein